MEIFLYLAKASGLLALFYVVYWFLLKKDTFHNFKRVFLLFGLVISVILPLLTYNTYIAVEPVKEEVLPLEISYESQITTSHITPSQPESESTKPIDWVKLITYAYFSVAFFVLTCLIYNYSKLTLNFRKFKSIKEGNLKIYEIEKLKSPFSFFRYIAINKNTKSTKDKQMIIAHEKVHVTHFHWIDILISNVFIAFFWFNPFLWLYRQEIKQNHEHIADRYAIQNIQNKKSYQYLLLNQVLPIPQNTVESYFFQPSIKQRIMMINKTQSPKYKVFKSILIVPILVFFFITFQNKVVAQKVIAKTNDNSQTRKDSVENALLMRINENTKDKKNSTSENQDIKGVPQLKYSVSSVTYNEDNNYLQQNRKSSFNPNTYVEKPFEILKEPAVKSSVIYGEGNKVLILKITKKADQEYLDYIKTLFRNKYKIYLTYKNIQFDENNLLTSLDLSVLTRDAKTVDYKIDTKDPIEDIYFYRDYSKQTNPEIGIVSKLPEFPKETPSQELLTKIQIAPEDEFKINTKNDASTILNLENVNTYIINGLTYKENEFEEMVVLVKKYEFIDENTFKIKGDVFRGDEIEEFFKTNNNASLNLENATIISIKKGKKPIAMVVNQNPNDVSKALEQKKKENKILEIENDGEISRLIITINKNSDKEYLNHIEKYLEDEHDIQMKTSKVKYNRDGLLTSIKVQIKTNVGFKGSASQVKAVPIDEFYIFRDFSKNAKVPFSIGSELPDENKKDINAKVISTFKISPENYAMENAIDEKLKTINIDKVEKFIINGEVFFKDYSEPLLVLIDKYEFINENELKISGKVYKGKTVLDFLNEDYKSPKPYGTQIISFSKNMKPMSFNLKESKVGKIQNN